VSVPIARRACAAAACAAALAAPTHAAAEIGPIELVSKTTTEQALEADETALSADGRYLAFSGSIGGLRGVFRKDLQTGAVVPVAAKSSLEGGGTPEDPAPSISADGRYVSFTTGARLDEDDDDLPATADVYVADMSSSPPGYELVSARDGCDPADPLPHAPCGLNYVGGGGSEVSGRTALSADGRGVAFFTTAESDLGGAPGDTPAGQIALRDLATDRTTLVSVERDSASGQMTSLPVAGGTIVDKPQLSRYRGAALSADGTTVAWLGTHLPAQVPLLADEKNVIAEEDSHGITPYVEPLWRRVVDGPLAPTRRIVGGGDPLAAGCAPTGTLADPACQAPFPGLSVLSGRGSLTSGSSGWLGPAEVDGIPQLSADGRTVAVIGNPIGSTNVFLVDMGDGLSRRQALDEITREVPLSATEPAAGVNAQANIPVNGFVFDVAISANGQRVAFVTARQQFALSPPRLIGSPPSSLGLTELYLVDRDAETLRRVTHGYGEFTEASSARNSQGEAQNGINGLGARSPSFDGNGALLAFASDAANLVEGDGNDAKDAFLVDVDAASTASGPEEISPGPRRRRLKRRWRLTLSAYSLPDGRVRLVAVVPAAGRLRAAAWGKLGPQVRTRRLAKAGKRARGKAGGPVKLTLGLHPPLGSLAHTKEGVYATARVSFRRGHRTLRGKLQIRFHAHGRHRGGAR
jgi:WD40-like Beta Propeller Repeat